MTRFGRVLKLDFVEGYKSMLWGVLCMTLLYLFFFWFAHNISFHDQMYYMIQDTEARMMVYISSLCEAVGAFGIMAMLIFFLIAASTLFRSEQKKQKRIAWLMLPASNLEKFLSRWVFLLVFSVVGGILPFFIADLIHMTYLSTTDYPVMFATDDFFSFMPYIKYPSQTWLSVTMQYMFIIAMHAFYLLGGVFFKKFHFIAVSAVMVFVLAAVISTANVIGLGSTIYAAGYDTYCTFMIVILTCLAVLFTWLSYWLFCRWQVITHKFVNL